MRLVTVRSGETTYAGRVEEGEVVPLEYDDVAAVLGHLADGADLAEICGPGAETGSAEQLSSLELAPVVPAPGKIVCVGLNYRAHIEEMGRELPEHPTVFAKYASALIGAFDPIRLPVVSDQMDWEAELAVVIGRRARRLSPAEALGDIAGYTVVNDVTARDYQRRTLQWLQGKTFEATSPLGPALVTPDEVDHAADLELSCEVDGEIVQRARTSDLCFSPGVLVSYLSRIFTLEPGDVIATGTPGGVGAGMDPPRFLKDGSVVRTVIEGLGACSNTCVADSE